MGQTHVFPLGSLDGREVHVLYLMVRDGEGVRRAAWQGVAHFMLWSIMALGPACV